MSDYMVDDDTYKGHIDWKLWRRILQHARPYKKQLLGLAGSGIFLAITETIMPAIIGKLIDEAIVNGLNSILIGYIVAYGVITFLMCLGIWFFIVIAGQAATGIAYDLRTAGFTKLQELSFSYYDVRPVGWLVSRLTSDCSKLSSLMPWFALDLCWGTSILVGITLTMFWLNWALALVVLSIVPPLVAISLFFQTKLLASSRLIRKTNSLLTSGYNESIMGVRTTKALVREEENLAEFQVMTNDMYQYSTRNALQSAVYLPLVITLGSIGVGLSLWRGGISVGSASAGDVWGSSITLGTLIAFMQYAALFYMPIQELARRFTDLQNAQAAAERVQSLLDTTPEIKDSPEVAQAMEIYQQQALQPMSEEMAIDGYDQIIREIEFRNVSFWYKEGEHILEDFNLVVKAGQTVALVGATGGGKSTLVSLVARFYEPKLGEILINGVDYRKRSLHWLQSNLGVVLQSPHLFSGTIRENISYGKLDANEQEIETAAKLANAHQFITDMDNGYNSEVGEGGSRLSTGQRQLVSLARAILADPQIFIMDEATSSVDTETEKLIQEGVDRVLANRIAFVIAHRLSTIRSADVILAIDGGRIVEQGSHKQLIARKGRYYELYTNQFARQREANVLKAGEIG